MPLHQTIAKRIRAERNARYKKLNLPADFIAPNYGGRSIVNVPATVIHVGELFREAVRQNAAAVIAVHNHPSGSTEESPEDRAVTRELVQAGKLLDVELIDNLIICGSGNRWISLKERGVEFYIRNRSLEGHWASVSLESSFHLPVCSGLFRIAS